MERHAYFDNAKLFLIFLVVFGHMIQPFVSQSHNIETLYTWLYTFHMPAFIFIAGFFAKGSGNIAYVIKLAKKLIIPYLIFQVIYTGYYFLIGKSNWLTDHIFYPHWSLWFLFSLFCWHILLIGYKKLHPVLGISIAVILGIIIGYFDQVGHTFSLSRTIVFFPYFLIGYWASMKHIDWLKNKYVKISAIVILIVVAMIIYMSPGINTDWLLASKSYSTLGMETFGSIARLTVYMTSILMAMSILSWIPKKRFTFTVLGERTMYVYLLHGFFVQYFREYELLHIDHFVDFLGVVFLSAGIVFLLSSKWVISFFQPFIELSMNRLKELFRKKDRSRDQNISA